MRNVGSRTEIPMKQKSFRANNSDRLPIYNDDQMSFNIFREKNQPTHQKYYQNRIEKKTIRRKN